MSIILAELLRGGRVESFHTGSFAVADAGGAIVAGGGDPDRAIYPRSAIKALQALPLAAGPAQQLGLTQAELALACASHNGAPVHAATALAMLAKAGRDGTCLECGAHWPTSGAAARALAASGAEPGPEHNNCSGKHAGFICTAIEAGQDPAGYIAPAHPTMRAVTAAVSAATGIDLAQQTPGTDGCSIPTYQMPLRALAAGFARFGTGQHLPADFAASAAALRQAVAAHPEMVAGEGQFDTVVMQALGDAAFIKVGAEGVYCGALPALGLGFALKIDDGAIRAAEVAAAALLRRYLGPSTLLDSLACVTLRNWNGREVGVLRAAAH